MIMNNLMRFVSLFVLLFAVGCTKEDESGGDTGGSGSTDSTNGYKYLSTLNITDAKSVYKQSATSASALATRSEEDLVVSGDTYWKMTDGGTEQLVFTGLEGETADIAIESIYSIGSRMLYVIPNLSDLWALDISAACHCIVDTETGKIYSSPFDLDFRSANSTEDANGDVFFVADEAGEYYIFKC